MGSFIPEARDLRDVEEMEGYCTMNWELLKLKMLKRWGLKPLSYQEGNLEAFILKLEQLGEVQNFEGFRKYKAIFERISAERVKMDALPSGGPLKRLFLRRLAVDVAKNVKH